MWVLQGTENQNRIVSAALAACDFPFGRLADGLRAQTGRSVIPVEWADLSRASATGVEAHRVEFRSQVLGLFWYSGLVQLDVSLERDERLAMEVFLSEGAHAVDVFYMTDQERAAVDDALHGGPDAGHGHDWFDVGSYESWVGEGFMGAFIAAFAPSVGVTLTQFQHQPTADSAALVRRVLLRETSSPVDDFPFVEVDRWAAQQRRWWPLRNRRAAQAYLDWKQRHSL